jgi:hypothetical protein
MLLAGFLLLYFNTYSGFKRIDPIVDCSESFVVIGDKEVAEIQAPPLLLSFYFSLATTNSGAHSSARLISESGKVQIAFRADSA